MISKIQNISFQSRFSRYSTHTPKSKPYREFEFMPELQYKNPITKFFKNMIEKFKGICDAMKPEKPKHFDIDAKDARGTTIQI